MKTLDTVIAMVIVLLVLSLIVQSLQSIIKKWFKLKSQSIQDSLHDLFKYAQAAETDVQAAATEATRLVGLVETELKKLGRVSLIRKNLMVDSIAKQDLMKILDRIGTTNLKSEVDKWYETVMQSFEERYTRHMKTVSLCISIGVVIFLNANFFQVYKNISNNDLLRNALIERREDVEARLKAPATASGQPVGNDSEALKAEALKKEMADLQKTLDETLTLGFTPITWQQVSNFFDSRVSYPNGRPMHAIRVLGGWAIMVMLLSVGAPFWQDALESLFGFKNLLRKKSDTKNVEDVGGQPRT
jgi:hypothetical protein